MDSFKTEHSIEGGEDAPTHKLLEEIMKLAEGGSHQACAYLFYLDANK